MNESAPKNQWQNIDPTQVENVDTAHELANEENQWHDAAVVSERFADQLRASDAPMAVNIAHEWDEIARRRMQMDGPIVFDALEKKLNADQALEEATAVAQSATKHLEGDYIQNRIAVRDTMSAIAAENADSE